MRIRLTLALTTIAALTVSGISPAQSSDVPARSAVSAVSAVAAPAADGRWRPDEGAKFNVPRTGPETQFRLEAQVLGAIRHARKGSLIRMAMFSFDRFPVADALIAAKKRGVRVQLLINDHEITPAQVKLRNKLGKKRFRKNFIYQCTKGCRSRGDVLHTKFFLFSHTGAARNVVMLGSLNMKLNGHKNQYNDLWTKNNADRLYEAFDEIFDQMRLDKPAKPMFLVKNIDPQFQIIETPFPVFNATNDPMMKLLKPVKCLGASTDSGRTIIRVNMHAWDGRRGGYLAERFRQLYAKGCDVKIHYGRAGRGVRRELSIPTARGRVPVRSSGFDTDEDELGEVDLYSHMKMVTIGGHYGDRTGRRMVVTGSSNYQDSGLTGDELIFRIFDWKTYNQYVKHWSWMWNTQTRPIIYVNKREVVNGKQVERTYIAPGPAATGSIWADE